MYDYEYRACTRAGRVCQELSLKAFGYDLSPEGIERVCRDYFTKWRVLFSHADAIAVLLWTSDGSEIFEFDGSLDKPFEWCRYIGIGNYDRRVTPEEAAKNYSLHAYPCYYKENPPEMTYGDLKNIITALKRVGKELTGLTVQVGETFDPGPEFAYSVFKYERHTEISPGAGNGCGRWVDCIARLHADNKAYAAFPDGIPEGTPLGSFLGRQFMALKDAVGFDYIWLSNGFGFALDSWNWKGEVFDGDSFDHTKAAHVREAIGSFWHDFAAEVGDTVIEVRGSNLSAGMDIASHGCPLDLIYDQNIIAPPNSPWAAMDYRFGLELAGYMSHIAALPKNGYSFRYYSHDPWWYNSPWFDRYDRSPHDIYLPLGIGRLDSSLAVTRPAALDFLTADDSFGRVPEKGAVEMTPHLLSALEDHPDAPGLVTWVYPFDEYCRVGLREGHPERILMDDWFIESAIDYGFPIGSVISDANFLAADKKKLLGTILVTPVPAAGSPLEKAILDAADLGCRVILYGSTEFASDNMRARIGVAFDKTGIDGELGFVGHAWRLDTAEVGEYAKTLLHEPVKSCGGVHETAAGAETMCEVSKDGVTRVYAARKNNIVWIRGSFPHTGSKRAEGHLPQLIKPTEHFVPSVLLRAALQSFGILLTFDAFDLDERLPLLILSRCREAMYFNLFSKDTTVRMRMTTPEGAPAPDNTEFIIENDIGLYPTHRFVHTDCRVYIKQSARGRIMVKKNNPETHKDVDERIDITGLCDAEVRFYPSEGGKAIFVNCKSVENCYGLFYRGGNFTAEWDENASCYIARHVSGYLGIGWCPKESVGAYKKLEFLRKVED